MSYIQFINHASVFITDGQDGILTDPWYEGSVFHNGWNLLYENKLNDIEKILNKTTYIWISHEHPDHFSIIFFKKYLNIIKSKNIKIIFQNTLDKRVFSFLNKLELNVIELKDFTNFNINKSFSIQVFKDSFYDSSLILKVKNKVIFNLNDCPIKNNKFLNSLKKKFGKCDILLTQFSYAAWKGGEKNISWRQKSAKEKLETMYTQSKILEAKIVIPFASFIYFSHKMNFYLNDCANKPNDVIKFMDNSDSKVVFLQPYEIQYFETIEQNKESLDFWNRLYNSIPNLKINSFDNISKYCISYG